MALKLTAFRLAAKHMDYLKRRGRKEGRSANDILRRILEECIAEERAIRHAQARVG